eukprot:sb/3470827/
MHRGTAIRLRELNALLASINNKHSVLSHINKSLAAWTAVELKVGKQYVWFIRTDRRETSKQPIRTRYLGHVTGYQPMRDKYYYFMSRVKMLSHLHGVGRNKSTYHSIESLNWDNLTNFLYRGKNRGPLNRGPTVFILFFIISGALLEFLILSPTVSILQPITHVVFSQHPTRSERLTAVVLQSDCVLCLFDHWFRH